MRTLFNDIGLVTGGLRSHLARLASIENDSSDGGGSTSTMEDGVDEEKLDEDELGDEDEDGQRAKRAKDVEAYRTLQSDRDRLHAENERIARENAELRAAQATKQRETREEVNQRTNEDLDARAAQLAREVVMEASTIPTDDPERSIKTYTKFFKTVLSEQKKEVEEVSRRTSREEVERSKAKIKEYEDTKADTIKYLVEAGLTEDDFEDVENLAIIKGAKDPQFFEKYKGEDQLKELVKLVKNDSVQRTRNSQEFQDERTEHRKPMRGVIDGSSARRRTSQDEDEEKPKGPGSMLADMARVRENQRKLSGQMFRQANRDR